MRRACIIILIISVISILVLPSFTLAFEESGSGITILLDDQYIEYCGELYAIKINGETIETEIPCIMYENRILVPLRAIFEKLGAEVKWSDESKTAEVTLGTTNVKVVLFSRKAEVNGVIKQLDVPAMIINGRTLLPVRFVSECLNYNVTWLPDEKAVGIDACKISAPDFTDKGTYWEVAVNSEKFNNFNNFTLKSPDRIVIDIPNVLAPTLQQTVQTGNDTIKSIRYALYKDPLTDACMARTVIDLSESRLYEVITAGEALYVRIYKESSDNDGNTDTPVPEPSEPTGVIYEKFWNSARITLENIRLPGSPEGDMPLCYLSRYEDEGLTYIIDIDGNLLDSIGEVIDPLDGFISQISYQYFEDIDTTTVCIRSHFPLYFSSYFRTVNSSFVILISKTPADNTEEIFKRSITEDDVILNKSNGSDSADTIEELCIYTGSVGYMDIKQLKNPTRVSINLPSGFETMHGGFSVIPGGSCFKYVEVTGDDDGSVTITASFEGDAVINIFERPTGIVLQANSGKLSDITFKNAGGNHTLFIKGTVLTEGFYNLLPLYTGEYDEIGNIYTVKFPSTRSLSPLKPGKIVIKDDLVEYIEIFESGGITEIKFVTIRKCLFEIVTRYIGDTNAGALLDTSINILAPPSASEKVVVIDPGHGGLDPGAFYFGRPEKEFNLDIARKLEKLLTINGIRTYLTRSDDSYVGLYERVFIARDLGADLFLSIHSNAFNGQARGTLTLYKAQDQNQVPAGMLTNKEFATRIQQGIISMTGTYDRGANEDTVGLAVLRVNESTASALTEVVFMDNAQDFALLCDEEFRSKVAAGLCTAIIESLQKLP